MKKTATMLLLLALPWITSCEKQLFDFVITIDQSPSFEVDQTGAFEVWETITSGDLRDALDIPDDADITDVHIEALSLRIEAVEGVNQATALTVSGEVTDLIGGRERMFDDFPVPLPTGFVSGLAVDQLIEQGISQLRTHLVNALVNDQDLAFDVYLEGDSNPPGQRIRLNIYLTIKATVNYSECLEVLELMSEGDACDGV